MVPLRQIPDTIDIDATRQAYSYSAFVRELKVNSQRKENSFIQIYLELIIIYK